MKECKHLNIRFSEGMIECPDCGKQIKPWDNPRSL